MPYDYVSKLDPAILQKARDELGETEQRLQQSYDIIREWLKKQPHLAKCPLPDLYIINFIRGCKYNLEKVKRKLDCTMTMRGALPEFFSGWNPFAPELQAILKLGPQLPLLEYDQLGRRVIVMRGGCINPLIHKAEDVEKVSFMVTETLGKGDEQLPITGLVVIIDMDGLTLEHLTNRSLSLSKKLMKFYQDAAPLRPQSINFVRTGSVFSTAFKVANTLVNEKIRQRFKVHAEGFESLHKEISKDVLPSDYGGNGKSLAELTDYWKLRVEQNAKSLAESEKLVSDESKRPGKPKTSQDLFGIEGSFRKLDID